MELDDRGIPITEPGATSAPACPPQPCQLCTGNSAVVKTRGQHCPRYYTSWEWCQMMNTCAATVDWEKIYEAR